MQIPDLVNGLFELFGGGFILLSIIKLHKQKLVRGVSWLHVLFFTFWGYWNLFYYPHLGQHLSLLGGIGVVVLNTAWVTQIFYYIREEKDGGSPEHGRY